MLFATSKDTNIIRNIQIPSVGWASERWGLHFCYPQERGLQQRGQSKKSVEYK